MRRSGLTYREILAQVPVAKSTLSLWLREVHLAQKQAQRLTKKRKAAQLRGGAARRRQRLETTTSIVEQSRIQIKKLNSRELWLIGLSLYWAEGSKEKLYAGASGVDFSNTDRRMIAFFTHWLKTSCNIDTSRIYAHLYIHEYQKDRVAEAKRHWTEKTGLLPAQITGVYFKRHNLKSRRHSFTKEYYGTLRVRVRRSSGLMRQIQGWVTGICDHNWGVV
ncbi:MAG: hypothetical protein UX77_C0032G0006 [Parcubacteria group bacterium GW2011_GWA1_47_11]|nr:MAG: hypothetical protein UX77_C0032G0006 [Parcubacteria group bacterium GW2011_GWA1_47_11]